jgi:hypothetical protein
MVGELITLPLRVTGVAVRFWWRAADRTLSLASGAVGQVIDRVSPADSPTPDRPPSTEAPSAPPVRPAPPQRQTPPTSVASPERPRVHRPTTEPGSARPVDEPAHVSEEPTLVEAFADPGAEDGAGPELHIREPWKGYQGMSARDITARLAGASAAELAAVELYERSKRGRQTILAAVARQLRSHPQGGSTQLTGANGSGS